MLPFYMPESENRSRTRNVQNRSTHSEQHGTHSSKQRQVALAPRREPWQFKKLRAEVSTTQLDFHWRIRWAFRTNFGVEILPECATTATPSVPMQLFQPKPADHTCAKVKNLMHRCADQRRTRMRPMWSASELPKATTHHHLISDFSLSIPVRPHEKAVSRYMVQDEIGLKSRFWSSVSREVGE